MQDVVIIGGGIIGSSIAYHLTRSPGAPRVAVIEPDPSYEFASTPRSAGGVRHIFSLPENIAMGRYGNEFYRDFGRLMAVEGQVNTADFKEGGYLFVYPPEHMDTLERNVATQAGLGGDIQLLDKAVVAARFPSLNLADVGGAGHSPKDGWIDPYGACMGFRRKAQSQGARYVRDRVVGIEHDGRRARAVRLERDGILSCDFAINAAGAWSPQIAAMVGMALPICPLRRLAFYFETPEQLEPYPLTKDLSGLFFRPEGAGYICGRPKMAEPEGVNFDVDPDYFEAVVWPLLAQRVPRFETLKVKRGWAGLYDQNVLDMNLIIGPWTGGVANFFVACGLSGHGLSLAPAVGRALAELVIEGRYTTIDLKRFGYQRVIDNAPLWEQGII